MLRMRPQKSAKRVEGYYGRSDGGYYLDGTELRRRWGGKGAGRLGLKGRPEFEQFKRLVNGLDPHTGEQLTAKLIANRLAAWDVTASVPKGVTIALEWGDDRIQEALAGGLTRLWPCWRTTPRPACGRKAGRPTAARRTWSGTRSSTRRPARWAKTTCPTRTGTSTWSSST